MCIRDSKEAEEAAEKKLAGRRKSITQSETEFRKEARKHALELAKSSSSGIGDEAVAAADSVHHKLDEIAHALDHDVPVDDIVVDAKVDGQHYPIGANLWVKRSDGSKSECTVKAYDPKDKTYTVSLDDGSSGEAISKIVKESKPVSYTHLTLPTICSV